MWLMRLAITSVWEEQDKRPAQANAERQDRKVQPEGNGLVP